MGRIEMILRKLFGIMRGSPQPMAIHKTVEAISMNGPDGPGPGGDPMPWDPIPY
jgi:hypothetical protein